MAILDFFPDDVNPEEDPADAQDWGPGFTDEIPEGEYIDDAPDPLSIDDESSWGVVTPEQQASADEINGVDQLSAENDWQAEVNRTQAESGFDAARLFSGDSFGEEGLNSSIEAGLRQQAQQQQTIANQRRQVNNGDWRVRLRLAPQADYLYNAKNPGILQPLAITDGVIFPYTPSISTMYKANYNEVPLTHSNYKGYFYQNSSVDPVNISCMFTAQGTAEANYLLAVIHFFRSATKMFYGQDAQRGAPPPLVYLSGLGEYQFNEHPCVISSFEYKLPADVDYIRAGSVTNVGLNLTNQRDKQTVTNNQIVNQAIRLLSLGASVGALPNVPAPPSLGINNPTYVPTKIDISITLLPMQSRQQVSKQFSVKEFANGNLLKGGFW